MTNLISAFCKPSQIPLPSNFFAIAHHTVNPLDHDIAGCMLCDQSSLRRRLRELTGSGPRSGRRGKPSRDSIERLRADIARSTERRADRERQRPQSRFTQDLPILEHRAEIVRAISEHQVIVVCGDTGSGKSTQLPKLCLEAGQGVAGVIGHTQPRRIAARSIATRLAEELHTPLGRGIGFKVRFSDRAGRDPFVKVMTDGILLAETQGDRRLLQYDTIIIDEAHERSLNIDFLLGYLRQLLPKRRDLKLIITSATIDPQRFSEHFGDAPIIEVSGRTYPVDVRYRPLQSDDPDEQDRDMEQAILEGVDEVAREGPGDVLVFLSGEREIRATAEALRKHHPPHTEILPLYARLSAAEQNRVFKSHPGRRIVLATNVAETSLTVPGIHYVIDTGLARISRYSARSKVQRLPIEPISQASAKQRAGRCGRVAPGVCIRLFAEDDHARREVFTPPEILRTNLAAVILQMKALRLGAVESFPFLEPPKRAMIRDGYETLHELGAIDNEDRLTDIGRQLSRLPIDPRIGRMIIAAEHEHCLTEVLIIAAALSVQDPRERPMERADAADEAQAAFADEQSDFLSYLKLWEAYHEQKRHLSWNKLRRWCRDNFLSFVRMREWHDIHGQLFTLVRESRMTPNREPADYENIHRALLAGLLSNIGVRDEGYEFSAARGSSFFVFPGSGLFDDQPKWLMAAEIVETTRRYARCVARIRPEWIERIAAHLVKRSYSDPYWDERSARVMAFERVSLFGVEIVSRRRVHYGPVDPAEARRLFIHHALVEGEFRTDAPFFKHNRRLVEEVREIEAQRRRRDVLVEPELQYHFYEQHIPRDIFTGRAFERWRKRAERDEPKLLFMSRDDLITPGAELVDPDQFPKSMPVGETELPLSYELEPGHADDGVTVTVPVPLLNQLPGERMAWLVPGMLREKVIGLIKTLPKPIRRTFVPIPDFVDTLLPRLRFGDGPLLDALAEAIHRTSGIEIPPEAWKPASIPDCYRMNVRVVNEHDEVLEQSRDLEQLRRTFGASARESMARVAAEEFSRDGITSWDLDDLPETVDVQRGSLTLRGYPALVDRGASVSLRLLESAEAAAQSMRTGLRRLFLLQCLDEVLYQVDHLPGIERMRLDFAPLGTADELTDQLAVLIADRAFICDDAEVRSRAAFDQRLDAGWQRLWPVGCAVAETVGPMLERYNEVQREIDAFDKPIWREAIVDIRAHLDRLMPRDVLLRVPFDQLRHYPRYLAAVLQRLDKLRNGALAKDREREAELAELWRQYEHRRADHEARGVHDPALETYRWMLEELRVSMFAQELGTAMPVSHQRLEKQWKQVRV